MAAPTSESFVLADPTASMAPPPAAETGGVEAEGGEAAAAAAAAAGEKDEKYDEENDADNDDDEDLDSLPSISTSVLSPSEMDDSVTTSDAQREWEASLEQLQLMLTMVLVPLVGKFLGRKFAYWSWARYMEWAHEVDIRITNKKAFNMVGAVEAVAML